MPPWMADSKTRGAAERCGRQTPKNSLRLQKSKARNRGNDLLRAQWHPGLSSTGAGSKGGGAISASRESSLRKSPLSRRNSARRNP